MISIGMCLSVSIIIIIFLDQYTYIFYIGYNNKKKTQPNVTLIIKLQAIQKLGYRRIKKRKQWKKGRESVCAFVYTLSKKAERKKESESGKRGNFNITIETCSYRSCYTY